MKGRQRISTRRINPELIMSTALINYGFTTPEIRLLMRQVLGHAISGRTIKRFAKTSGQLLKRGRPRTSLRVQKGEIPRLMEETATIHLFSNSALQFFSNIETEFGLTPRQYLKWITAHVLRGRFMMRKCLSCAEMFPSSDSGQRHCKRCRLLRQRLVREDKRSIFNWQE